VYCLFLGVAVMVVTHPAARLYCGPEHADRNADCPNTIVNV
jgi:hypothetical protein